MWKWEQRMFWRQIISKELVSPQKQTPYDLYPALLLLTSLFLLTLCSLLPHRQYRGDSGGSGLCRHPGLHHSFHQEGSNHRAALRLPAGLPGLPDCRALLSVSHSVVSLSNWIRHQFTSATSQNKFIHSNQIFPGLSPAESELHDPEGQVSSSLCWEQVDKNINQCRFKTKSVARVLLSERTLDAQCIRNRINKKQWMWSWKCSTDLQNKLCVIRL